MALKDWVRRSNERYYVQYRSRTEDDILIIEAVFKDINRSYNPPKWRVTSGGSFYRGVIKDFLRSKAEGIKEAKRYMRTH